MHLVHIRTNDAGVFRYFFVNTQGMKSAVEMANPTLSIFTVQRKPITNQQCEF